LSEGRLWSTETHWMSQGPSTPPFDLLLANHQQKATSCISGQ
jgi:hypothetical protein